MNKPELIREIANHYAMRYFLDARMDRSDLLVRYFETALTELDERLNQAPDPLTEYLETNP